jgi:hypothetical protein
MKRLLLAALLSFAGLAPASATPPADEAIFVEGSRYDAVLSASRGDWRLLPLTGSEVRLRLAEACRAGPTPPPGLWLLSRDAAGRPELVAPSATALPAGHPGRIPLVGCGEDDARALAVPDALADWLQQHSGAIYVTR